eukprot:5104801-Ditylum_brightwellii.AAC.1
MMLSRTSSKWSRRCLDSTKSSHSFTSSLLRKTTQRNQQQWKHRPTSSFIIPRRSYHLAAFLGNVTSLQNNDSETTANHNPQLHRQIQVRYKRKGGASAFKPRPPTRKQRKEYYRRQRRLEFEQVGKHSAPGSVAGPLRQEDEEERQFLLSYAKGEIPLIDEGDSEYDLGDALLDDLFGNSSSALSQPNPKRWHIGHRYNGYLAEVSDIMKGYHAYLENKKENEED